VTEALFEPESTRQGFQPRRRLAMREDPGMGILNAQGFAAWLMTEKGLSEKWAKDTAWYVVRKLAQEDTPFPHKKDAETLALKILCSTYSKSHKRNLLKAIEHYMEYVGEPVHFKKPSKGKRLPRYLTQEEMRKLVRVTRNYRELAILTVFCTTGLRLNEARMLNLGDLDFVRRTITVRCAKLSRDREVPMSEDCARVLKVYIERYFEKGSRSPEAPLFLSLRGSRPCPHALSDVVRKCGERAELPKPVYPHLLRHSFATAMIGNGCDLFHLSDILGHSNIETTTIYLHVNNDARRAAFERGVPRI
jgi:site-specific recombinase XerD